MQRLAEAELAKAPSEVLEIVCKLGKGSYGSVYMAKYKATGVIVAVKKVPVDSDLSDIVKEISIMQQCDSPYIVKCFGSLFDSQDLWICMEYCGAGSVADIMRFRNQTLRESEIATVLQYSLKGLHYLHELKKIHRDIKAGNILLTSNGTAKLADFGVAGQLSDTLARRNTVIGTPYWMAPEVIQETGYNCSADIWSLGITAVEMADGKPPLGDIHPMRALFMIPSQPAPTLRSPASWSGDFRAFVSVCLAKAPEARPSADSLLNTEFICTAKPRAILLPLIKEANEVRRKRLAEAAASGSGTGNTRRPERRAGASPNRPAADAGAAAAPATSAGVTSVDDTTGTMVRRSTGGNSMKQTLALDADAAGTLISLTPSATSSSSGSSSSSTGSPGKRSGTGASTGTGKRRDGGGGRGRADCSSSSDGLGTMVIKGDVSDGEDECGDAEFEDTGSVVVHGTSASSSGDAGGIGGPFNGAGGGGGGGTLTRKREREAKEAAAAAAAAGSGAGAAGGGPAVGVAQRPFAPFSRALQESGMLAGGANEPGGLTRLTYAELEQLLSSLSVDLETELRNLAVRYRHKRQPLLDAIAEKTAAASASAAGNGSGSGATGGGGGQRQTAVAGGR